MSHHILSVFVLLFCWDFHTIFYNENFTYRFSKEANKIENDFRMSFTTIATIHHHLICIIKYHKPNPVLKSQFRFKVLDITSLQNTAWILNTSHTLLSLLYTAFTDHLQAMPLLLNSYVLVWINFFYTNRFLKPLDFSVRIYTWFSSLLCCKLCAWGWAFAKIFLPWWGVLRAKNCTLGTRMESFLREISVFEHKWTNHSPNCIRKTTTKFIKQIHSSK